MRPNLERSETLYPFTNEKQPIVIVIDHGYGNIKTAHTYFKSGMTTYEKEPVFKSNLLVFGNDYYIIGDEHMKFSADKTADQDYYILTLAAIGIELAYRNLITARVHLAVGHP